MSPYRPGRWAPWAAGGTCTAAGDPVSEAAAVLGRARGRWDAQDVEEKGHQQRNEDEDEAARLRRTQTHELRHTTDYSRNTQAAGHQAILHPNEPLAPVEGIAGDMAHNRRHARRRPQPERQLVAETRRRGHTQCVADPSRILCLSCCVDCDTQPSPRQRPPIVSTRVENSTPRAASSLNYWYCLQLPAVALSDIARVVLLHS